jgi:hypothetical protein
VATWGGYGSCGTEGDNTAAGYAKIVTALAPGGGLPGAWPSLDLYVVKYLDLIAGLGAVPGPHRQQPGRHDRSEEPAGV